MAKVRIELTPKGQYV